MRQQLSQTASVNQFCTVVHHFRLPYNLRVEHVGVDAFDNHGLSIPNAMVFVYVRIGTRVYKDRVLLSRFRWPRNVTFVVWGGEGGLGLEPYFEFHSEHPSSTRIVVTLSGVESP